MSSFLSYRLFCFFSSSPSLFCSLCPSLFFSSSLLFSPFDALLWHSRWSAWRQWRPVRTPQHAWCPWESQGAKSLSIQHAIHTHSIRILQCDTYLPLLFITSPSLSASVHSLPSSAPSLPSSCIYTSFSSPYFSAYSSIILISENVAKQFNISRAEQDAFSLSSHKKAADARRSKVFEREIVAVGGVIEDDGNTVYVCVCVCVCACVDFLWSASSSPITFHHRPYPAWHCLSSFPFSSYSFFSLFLWIHVIFHPHTHTHHHHHHYQYLSFFHHHTITITLNLKGYERMPL